MGQTRVAIFGSTGSIGRSALEVITHLSHRLKLVAIAAHRSVEQICAQAHRYQPSQVVLTDPVAAQTARKMLGTKFQLLTGTQGLKEVVETSNIDILIMAMTGTVGLIPVMKALTLGKRVALATKEILVAYGDIVMKTARRYEGELLPVDSELTALYQCLDGKEIKTVRRMILTASGGPFWQRGQPDDVKVSAVLNHPTWKMGKKITVDSATMMNKGLEIISAVRLFGVPFQKVATIIHPESIVHSLIEFQDSSIFAQLSTPDMRLPIHYCLTYPERLPSLVKPLRLEAISSLRFYPIPRRQFPCLALAERALRTGPLATCVLNAANEVAVQAFLQNEIAFKSIPSIIRATLNAFNAQHPKLNTQCPSLNALRKVEIWALDFARSQVNRHKRHNKNKE
ncbi:MAG: 1-deoxy-D-xylulose-5-phosphate reductoisomerase [candidate division WOR-3 bacterium]